MTSLSEISERLAKQYEEKFGPDIVKLIMDSSPVSTLYIYIYMKIMMSHHQSGHVALELWRTFSILIHGQKLLPFTILFLFVNLQHPCV